MNATLFNGGKVHRMLEGVARCGVGKRRQRAQWQMELGDVTCRRCVKLNEKDGRKEAQEAQKVATTECEPHGRLS